MDNTLIEVFQSAYDGKLLLRNEIHLDDPTLNMLVKKHYFKLVPSFKSKLLYSQCLRCGNKNKAYIGKINCAPCNTLHPYCRKCMEMGRTMPCEPLYRWVGGSFAWTKYIDPCSWTGTLTKVQARAAKRIRQAIQSKEEELLVWAVCGAGKTEMLYPGITEALKSGKRVCIATPRADVVRELKPRIEQAFQQVQVQALYGGSRDKEANAQLLLATTHQLLRFSHAFDVMIIDEIDAYPYHADSSLPFATTRAKKHRSTTIYLTATPRKQHQRLIQRKRLPHIFVPNRYHGHPLPVPKLKMTFSLQKDLQNNLPPATFLTWLKRRKQPTRQLLIFVPTIALAENLKQNITTLLLQEKIITSPAEIDFVHAEDQKRTEKVQQFRKKQLRVIITTTILERGVTFPSVDVAIFDAGHDVFDEAALVQIAGRAGRSAEDPTGEVLFFHDGKTDALVQAVHAIKQMNQRGGF